MASTSHGDDNNVDIEEQLVINVAGELRSYIPKVEKKIDVLENLQDENEINEEEIGEPVVLEIEQLRQDHIVLRRTLYKFLHEFFWPDGRGNLELKRDGRTENPEHIKILKTEIEGLKKEEDDLNEKAIGLLSKLNADYETSSTNAGSSNALEEPEESANLDNWLSRESIFSRSSTYNVWNSSEEDHDENARLLSKKLKIMKYYYLDLEGDSGSNQDEIQMRVVLGLQQKFGWLRTANDYHADDNQFEGNDFEVTNVDALREKIRMLTHEKKRETVRVRREGKRSLMEWRIADRGDGRRTNLDALYRKAIQIGILLSRHSSNFFFVVVESGPALNKFSEHLTCILKWLDEMGKTAAIKTIVSVLEVAERELLVKGKFDSILSAISKNAKLGKQIAMDRILEMFLKEILCLESTLSHPILSKESVTIADHEETKNFQIALEECEKEVDKIRLEMAYLTSVHKFVFEEMREDLLMEDFQRIMDWIVSAKWEELEENYETN